MIELQTIDKNDTKFMFPEIKDTIKQNIQDYQCNYDEDGFVYYTLWLKSPLKGKWELVFYLPKNKNEYTAKDFVISLRNYYFNFVAEKADFVIGVALNSGTRDIADELFDLWLSKEEQIKTLLDKLRNEICSYDDLYLFKRV